MMHLSFMLKITNMAVLTSELMSNIHIPELYTSGYYKQKYNNEAYNSSNDTHADRSTLNMNRHYIFCQEIHVTS
jgi:hypothetical protein